MTKELAIRILTGDVLGTSEQTQEAVTMAVKALLMPPAQPQRMKGRWERHYSRPNVYADLCWHCSNCGYASNDSWANKWKYCPGCGADMRGEQDG